jgi:hypothetical protein
MDFTNLSTTNEDLSSPHSNKYKKIVKFFSTFVIVASFTIFLIFRLNNILNEYKREILNLNTEISELNEYVDELIDYIETTPPNIQKTNTIYKYNTVEKLDTVFIENKVDFYDIEPIRVVDFSVTDKEEGVYIHLHGYTKFMWNMDTADYDAVQTEITDKIINLNMSVNYSSLNNVLNLRLNNPSPDVNIMFVENGQLDLRRVYVADKSRWGVGITGGVGFVNSGFTPFIGVGISYQFMDISFRK